MSKVYHAINKINGSDVTLYYNDRCNGTPRYELWCKGHKGIVTEYFNNIGDANRAYNKALV